MYYSLKTKTEEHCLELRLFGGYNYAVYDLKENLIKPKETIKESDVIKFIHDTQVRLNAKFEKLEVKEVISEEKEEKPELSSKSFFEGKSFTKSASGILGEFNLNKGDKVISSKNESLKLGDRNINQSTMAIARQAQSEEEVNEMRDNFTIKASLNYKTGLVSIEVSSLPSESLDETCDSASQVIDRLLFGLVASFPSIMDNHFITAGAKQKNVSYDEFSKKYHAHFPNLSNTTAFKILEAIGKAVETYKLKSKN